MALIFLTFLALGSGTMLIEEKLKHWLLACGCMFLSKVVWVNHIGRRKEIAFGSVRKSCWVCKTVGLDNENIGSVVEGGDHKTKTSKCWTRFERPCLLEWNWAGLCGAFPMTDALMSPAYYWLGKEAMEINRSHLGLPWIPKSKFNQRSEKM